MVVILIIGVKHLYDRIIPLRREIYAHETSLTSPLLSFIEVPVLSHKSDRSCICVL